MTDIEIITLCAQAMGLDWYYVSDNEPQHTIRTKETGQYWPLEHDGQAMALAKEFGLTMQRRSDGKWGAWRPHEAPVAHSDSLNRTICECVAAMRRDEGPRE